MSDKKGNADIDAYYIIIQRTDKDENMYTISPKVQTTEAAVEVAILAVKDLLSHQAEDEGPYQEEPCAWLRDSSWEEA